MATVFLNGRFFGSDEAPAMVSVFDAGLQHAVALFETMQGGCVRGGGTAVEDDPESRGAWVRDLDEHLERLHTSARELGLASVLHTGPLGEAVLRTVARSGLPLARVRLTITGGDLNLLNRPMPGGESGAGGPPRQDPTVLVTATPATRYPAAMIEKGVPASVAQTRVSPLHATEGHKTSAYWWRLRELQLAAGRGAGESLVFSTGGHLVGGCVSNAIVVKGQELITPIARGEEAMVAREATDAERVSGVESGKSKAWPSPVLPGITRQWALHAAEGRGMTVRRRMVSVDDVLAADELFLTNSSWGVLPVVMVESSTIGSGEPGPLTKALTAEWAAELARLSEPA